MLDVAAEVLGKIDIGVPAPAWMVALTAMQFGK
jgi:hypothetical protein